MREDESVELADDARDALLGIGGSGVLSFATGDDDPPHSIPVSYGYDATDGVFYFRLAVDTDSAKHDVLENAVSFVVFAETDDGWQSVVATGHLESTTTEAIENDTLAGLQRVHIPIVDIFGVHPREIPFEFYRLDPDRLTGRAESRTDV